MTHNMTYKKVHQVTPMANKKDENLKKRNPTDVTGALSDSTFVVDQLLQKSQISKNVENQRKISAGI